MNVKKIVAAIVLMTAMSVFMLASCGNEDKNKIDVAKNVIIDIEEIVESPMPFDVEEIVVKG